MTARRPEQAPRRALGTAVAVAALLGTARCAVLEDTPPADQLVCGSDAECGPRQVCFADGCGDPGRDIVVEVAAAPREGLHAQDFAVENLRPQQDLQLFGPAALHGQVLRATSLPGPDGGVLAVGYREPVTVRATGQSRLIPGVARRYESTLVPGTDGWRLPVGAGDYTVTLVAGDTALPPVANPGTVDPGAQVPLDFQLPAAAALVRLDGTLVRQGAVLVDAELEVQALDASLQPLSQRVRVERGTGHFTLFLPPEAARLPTVLVAAMGVSGDDLVPHKTFVVDPAAGTAGPLELGDYGAPVRVGGRVLDSAGQPVVGATVSLRGKVGGGGTFGSRVVLTGTDGRFEVLSLPSAPDAPLTLVAVPPPTSTARITLQDATVPRALTTLPDVTCPDRLPVTGTLLKPDGTPAAGTRVVAEPVGEVPGWPRPASGAEPVGTTDESGQFVLRLDPAQYRLDFIPGENLPRVSRFATVSPPVGTEVKETRLEPFTLYKGRSITGRVTMPGGPLRTPDDLVPYASIRFFRVVTVEGQPSAVLLSQTVSDSSGHYTAVLPTR